MVISSALLWIALENNLPIGETLTVNSNNKISRNATLCMKYDHPVVFATHE
jgi:hypothetical protein